MMFRFGHATHPRWQQALELVLAQLEGQRQLEQFESDAARPQKLGLLYVTNSYAEELPPLLEVLRQRTGFMHWLGGVAPGVCSAGVEYVEEPALVVMLLELPADSARIFLANALCHVQAASLPRAAMHSPPASYTSIPSLIK
ncbi:MAG: hypothetical protein HC848_07890 [Limnobacter sp.]|nr:hypothetical protein [Limnobacter sp.]